MEQTDKKMPHLFKEIHKYQNYLSVSFHETCRIITIFRKTRYSQVFVYRIYEIFRHLLYIRQFSFE